ncbi:SusD/RagB family nutrient-binding outer membrane lipoprotein [Mangrovimonas sp. AS39]|uniref:SusD/RagB family nutrient-binding outer membrane lipoprotein n=1 Tax=Mangrovimonas futianensis TaxID=2895523 RepID=UPI001E4701C9|nr:SusD/RagB family nutrient-binding outer membrane lipoprotein [Mangrovimonas futianensis]MCF1190657.1 SusD/RagB family nutrient-binding outer membrane lipoprotein [Mangrovimonas futianensis]MCF1194354.1 SusD/RagB family nutrient-binding outer membrane lipoprotein [Mangrovimonas futianensis]MCF1420101.1 SusD/RagB family nutrient-binding outer membrane lipoprotein [Mangrovimonas futianensis]
MKKLNKLFTLLIALTLLNSCSNYLDINDPIDNPTADLISPDLILAGAQTRIYSTQAGTMNRLGNVFMNNWSANVNAFTGGFNEEYQMIMTSTFYSSIWDGLYIQLGNFQAMIDSNFEGYNQHVAIAKIMKSFYFQYLVDLYGDCPYSEAFQGNDNLTPAYDDEMAIYRALIVELDEAIALIQDGSGYAVGVEDVIYGGNMASWERFANTVKLKILMREATKAETDGETATYLNEQFASLSQNFISTDVTINPGYAQDAGRQNPFYGTYGYNVDDSETTSHRFVRASKYAADFVNGTPGIPDPRGNEIYEAIGGVVIGVEQGIDSNDPNIPEDISPIGPGLLKGHDQDGILMLAAESYFLQSEAAFRNYISGDAKALFQAGITASFDYYDLSATSYIANGDAINEIGWDGSANKIEAIMTQKWLATNGINAIESWIEYTRTGYPEIPLALSAQRPNKPNRLLYPASELIANAANVPSQNAETAFSTYIFWDATQN